MLDDVGRRHRDRDGMTGSDQSHVRGRLLVGGSTLLYVVGLVLALCSAPVATVLVGDRDTVADWAIPVAVAATGSFVGGILAVVRAHLRSRGRRHLVHDASSRNAPPDHRQLVIYLRPFTVDTIAATPRFTLFGSPLLSVARTEEEHLARTLAPIGPMITVGQPGEPLPYLGAARIYMTNEWHQAVLQLIQTARLVVLAAGYGESFLWELRHTIASRHPATILLLIPFGPDAYATFRERLGAYFPRPLPDYPPGKTRIQLEIRGAVYFDPDWTPHFVRFDIHHGPTTTSIRTAIARSLRPVFYRYGLPAP